MWCDATSMATGVEIDDVMVEDAAGLRKKSDYINVAELDATIKGINLALK